MISRERFEQFVRERRFGKNEALARRCMAEYQAGHATRLYAPTKSSAIATLRRVRELLAGAPSRQEGRRDG